MKLIERKNRLPLLHSARLVMRDIQLADISQEYIDWLNDEWTTRFLEIRFIPQTRERVERYIQARLDDTDSAKHFGVYDQEGTRLIGTVTLPRIDWRHLYAEISFVIGHPEARGKGYATEAVHTVTYYMFKECGIAKLMAGYYEGNDASARVLEKVGFQKEGRMKGERVRYDGKRGDHIWVGLLNEEFKPDSTFLGKLPLERL